jgi:hypothetical protein
VRNGRVDELASTGWDPADVPDPEDAATFERAKLDWDECELAEHASMRAWYRGLIALRRAVGDLRDDNLDEVCTHVDDDAGVLIIERGHHLVVGNLGTDDLDLGAGLRVGRGLGLGIEVQDVLAWSDRSGFGFGVAEPASVGARVGDGRAPRVAADGVLIARVGR